VTFCMSPPSKLARYQHLLGKIPDAEIARRAGLSGVAVSAMRRRRGIARFETERRPWAAKARLMLGKVSDAEIARRVGVIPMSVSRLRHELGIARVPASRTRTKIPKAQAAAILGKLTPKQRVVFVGRFMTDPPRSLAEIGRELGVSKQAVSGIEARLARRV